MNDARGSMWHRWDLHIHTPKSIVGSEYGGDTDEVWDKFINELEKLPKNIKAIGINDYLIIDGYKKVLEYKLNGRLQNIELILPVIEIRLKEFVGHKDLKRLNYHIIFADSSILSADQIELQFLNGLRGKAKLDSNVPSSITWGGVVSRDSLIDLGKAVYDSIPLDKRKKNPHYLEIGFNNINFELGKLEELLGETNGENTYLKDKYLKAIGKSEWENFTWDGSISEKKSIINGCHFVFVASENCKQAKQSKEVLKLQNVNNRLLHCSDAHNFCSDSNNTKSKELSHCFTWIKADTTFEGLKQVIYEPDDRLKIQINSPYEDRKKVYLNSIQLEGNTGFIVPNNTTLQFNRELVAIIGGRGSGKSALLELIAFLNEEHTYSDQNDKPKIIEYFRKNIDRINPAPGFTLKAKIIDKDNQEKEYTKQLDNINNYGLPFLYIGQEQLSSLATNDSALTKKVCDLINLDFDEVQKTSLIEKARELLSVTYNLREEIIDLKKKYSSYTKDKNFDIWLREYIQKKIEQKKTLSSQETRKLLEEISKEIDRRMNLRDYSGSLDHLMQNIRSVELNQFISNINKLEKQLYKHTSPIPLIDFTPIEKTIEKKKGAIATELTDLLKSIEGKKSQLAKIGLKEDITALLQAIENLQREINSANNDLRLYREKLKLLHQKVMERNNIYKQIQKQVESSRDAINEKFSEFKQSRDSSPKEERDLFKSIIEDVSIQGAIGFDQDIFCNYLLVNCLDRRKIKNQQEVQSIIAGKENGIAKEITLDSLIKWIEADLSTFLNGDNCSNHGQKNLLEYIFLKWQDFIKVKAIAQLNQFPTEKLSVGQRGTLLLKIYLATASVKQIFIVDQPEDNLDNQFIMNKLVPLIKKIKRSRQIILSTHNANLVVNGDAEQVVIAELDQEVKKYVSGSIEDPKINNKIKDILEGGEQAFRNREEKYGMRPI